MDIAGERHRREHGALLRTRRSRSAITRRRSVSGRARAAPHTTSLQTHVSHRIRSQSMAALGLMCTLRPASGKLAQARLHRQEQHATKSDRGCTGVLGSESPRHNPFEKNHGRPHCTNRGRGKTSRGHKGIHPRWRGPPTDRDLRNSPNTKSLTRAQRKHQNDHRLYRLPCTQDTHLRITAAHAREITFPNQRAISLQQSQQRDVIPTNSFRTTSLIPTRLDLPSTTAMTPLDMLTPALAGFLCSVRRTEDLLILWTRGIAITNFRPTRKPLSSRILGKTAAFHCYSNRTVREIFHLSAMQTRSSRTPQSSLDRSMCLGISKPRFFDHPLKHCMTPLQKVHGRVHHRSDPATTRMPVAFCVCCMPFSENFHNTPAMAGNRA